MNPVPNAAATLEEPTRPGNPTPGRWAGVRWWAVALFALLLAGVTWGSLQPGAPSMRFTMADKVQHFAAYGGLGALAFAACRRFSWRVALAVVGYGIAIEVAQGAEALGRFASPLDALANTAGVTAAALLWRPWRRG